LNDEAYFQNRNARHDLRTAQIQNEMRREDMIYEIIQNYITVLGNQKRLALQSENIRIQESIVTESNQLFRQQRITQFEVQQSEINLLNARISVINAQNRLNNSRNALFELVNIHDDGKPLAEIELYSDFDIETYTREVNFEQILRLKAHNETVDKHRTNITRTRLNFFPQMSLDYLNRRTLSSEDMSFDNVNRQQTSHTIGLNVTYSLNGLFRNHFTHRQAMYLEEHNKLDTGRLQREITLNFNQYLEELKYLQQLNVLQQSRVVQTAQNLAMAQQRFRLGLVTQLDLDKASFENLNSQLDLEANRYDLILKKLQIDHLLSNPLHNN
jgi:outer membrane protein TolC